jgi:putative flippase GtrA
MQINKKSQHLLVITVFCLILSVVMIICGYDAWVILIADTIIIGVGLILSYLEKKKEFAK